MAEQWDNIQFALSIGDIPHCRQLGIKAVSGEKGSVLFKLEYSEDIVGNPETGVIHGGPITTLLDTCLGASCITAMEKPQFCPTIDLRVDYMRPAKPNKPVFARGYAYRVTSNVVFTKGNAYHEGEEDHPIAHCVATFMRIDPPETNLPPPTRFSDVSVL